MTKAIKMPIREITAAKLRDVNDEELKALHDRLHQLTGHFEEKESWECGA